MNLPLYSKKDDLGGNCKDSGKREGDKGRSSGGGKSGPADGGGIKRIC